jgi:FkbM family methyltransferase
MHELANSILPGDIVFDVGANQGDKAAWFLAKGARVVCVEPQPAMVEILHRRFDSNPNATIVPKGLGAKPGKLEMSINSNTPVLSTFSENWKTGRFAGAQWDEKALIEITTLDDIVREFGVPRYTKIDVEGFETQVFLGLSKRIGCVSFEFTGEFVQDATAIMGRLRQLGYVYFNFSVGENDHFALDHWNSSEEVSARLIEYKLADPIAWGDVYAV